MLEDATGFVRGKANRQNVPSARECSGGIGPSSRYGTLETARAERPDLALDSTYPRGFAVPMRIIGGTLRRRSLESPSGYQTTRPMPDLVRESLFNLLRGHSEDAVVLDLFSGSGAIGLEAVSRGAARCVMVERDRAACEVIERNVRALGVEDRCEVVRGDALSPVILSRAPKPVHLIFFDPPFPLVWDRASWERCRSQLARLAGLLDDTGYLVVRTPWPAIRRIDEHPTPENVQKRARNKGRRKVRRGDWQADAGDRDRRGPENHGEAIEEEMELEDWEIERFLREGAAGLSSDAALTGDGGAGRASRPRYEEVDLSIEGAIGPETHEYGRMGVHLYMRRR